MMKSKCLLIALFILLGTMVMAQPVTISPTSANIDPGESVTITASGALYYVWSPATGLSTTEGPETVASPTVTTTYTCEGYAPGDESVVNGDFSLGNTGFTSAYVNSSNLWAEGTYFVDSDASLHHTDFHGYGHEDNTNFMMVNGAISPGTNVWTEQITVNPGKWYAFSTWACTLAGSASQVAQLQFSINGTQIGEVFTAPAQTMVWEQFYELWYSGTSTTATITILNQNTNGDGNDFGLDDISFRELVLVGSPQCTIIVGSMSASASADNTELCEGQSTTLHALPTGGSGNYSYSWTPANTLDDPTVQHPVANPALGNTIYTCQVTDNSWGGSQTVSVAIAVHPNEETHEYHNICPGETYSFYGVDYYSSGDYAYHDQTQYGCDSIVNLHLNVYQPNDTTLIERSICEGDSYLFHGEWYDQDGQVVYFDTIDSHGCLKVEKLVLTVGQYQTQYWPQYECYEHGTIPAWTWDKNGVTYHSDTIDQILLDDPNGGCDILHTLDLKFHEDFYDEKTVRTCGAYTWPINDTTYTESQNWIEKTFLHTFGTTQCDSTYVLHLEIQALEPMAFTIDTCDSYKWDRKGKEFETADWFNPDDDIFTASSTYHRTYESVMGCDSIVTLYLNLEYTPDPYEICPVDANNASPHWVVTATEFQINTYDYTLWEQSHNTCEWDSIRWEFEDPEVQWILEPDTATQPHGMNCRMYVLNYVDDTVWLKATVFNDCAPNGVSRRYWLVSSFYGIDEQPGIKANIYPNPSYGTFIIEADKMEHIRVIDMLGQVVSDKECNNHENQITLNLDTLSASVYLVEIKTTDGICKRRIVINR